MRMPALVVAVAALATTLGLAGCATLPGPVERAVTHASSDVADTSLARIAAASAPPDRADLSGFRLLADDEEALEARLALVRRAEKTIDVQCYLIANDATGLEFLGALAEAAGRGVRVRVLVDDLYAAGEDATFVALASHADLEVRLFNPLPVRGGGFARRVALSLHDFSRINHRMHNKLMIVDGRFAITGGRNVADEYFDRSGAAHFIDMDLLSSGAVIGPLSAVLDRLLD
jgi:putative cardiolipin synthase